MSKKKGNGLVAVLVVLVLALLAVVGVIVFKQIEYGENEAFHESLRGISIADIKQTQEPIHRNDFGITPMPEGTATVAPTNVLAITNVPATDAPTDAVVTLTVTPYCNTVAPTSVPTMTSAPMTDAPTNVPVMTSAPANDAPVIEAPAGTNVPDTSATPVVPPEPTHLPPIDSETAHTLMRQMFLAAAGTTLKQEQALWEQYAAEEAAAKQTATPAPTATATPADGTQLPETPAEPTAVPEPTEKPLTKKEKIALRQEELRINRENTLIWLTEALTPAETAAPTVTPVPTATPAPDPAATPEPPVWTIEDAYAQFEKTETGREYIGMLTALGAANAQDAMILMREACAVWMSEIDADKLRAINSDYACWIYCADTQIDYPVAHGEDNEYYVDHMFNKKRNAAGALFIDRRNLPDFQDPNTLIYGHNMRNDSMFGILNNYEIDGYFEVHPYFLIVSEKEIALIEVFAGYTTSKYDHCYDIALSDDEDMLAFVREAQRKSDFDTTVEIRSGDRLVTLSTCAYAFENARYIVIGRLDSLWKKGR